jgi:tetratricopeptide (TPR) repeat protein
MNRRNCILLLLLLLICLPSVLISVVKPEVQAIEDTYNRGDLVKAKALIKTTLADTPDEKAVVFYYTGLLDSDPKTAKSYFQMLIESYPKSEYSQKALFELGNLSLLDREYTKALEFYNKITDPEMVDKHYWIATTYYQSGDYTRAIASGEQCIRYSKDNHMLEDVYYLIADAYISLNQYNNAIITLNKLLAKPDIIADEQYLRYRLGYAYEMLANKLEAITQYKKGYEIDRFSQLAFSIEDRVFEMRYRYGASLDLSFLYPFANNPLPDIVIQEQLKAEQEKEQAIPDSTQVAKENKPMLLNAAPEQGFFLQAGRFSQDKNAIKLCEKIIAFKQNAQYYKSTQFKDVSWVVVVGPYKTQQEATDAKDLLKDNEIDSFVVER